MFITNIVISIILYIVLFLSSPLVAQFFSRTELTSLIRAMGAILVGAFVSTWALILSYVGVVCFEAVSFPTIIQYIFPEFLKGYIYTVKGFDIYAS